MEKYSFLNAAHTSYFAEMYDRYLQNPDEIEPSWKAFFQGFDFGVENSNGLNGEKTIQEEKELSKWLNKSESELKIVYGQPDKIEFLETRNRNYIYVSEKFKIKCERKFEINQNNTVIGFTSKNCF